MSLSTRRVPFTITLPWPKAEALERKARERKQKPTQIIEEAFDLLIEADEAPQKKNGAGHHAAAKRV